jgi:hypothetical protein
MAAAAFDAMNLAEIGECSSSPVAAEPPVLLVEEDSAPVHRAGAVRREDYRHLFSRLRSG